MNDSDIGVCKFIRNFPREEEITHGRGPTFYYLSRKQVKLGVNVHIICAKQGRERDYEVFDGINVHNVRLPYSFYALRKFRQLNKRFKIDVVHTHATSGMAYALFRKTIGQKPFVVHVHHIRRGAKGIPFFYSPINYLKTRFWTYASTIRQKLIWKKADMIIAVSKAVAKDVLEIYKVPSNRVRVVYNGFVPEIFEPREINEDIIKKLGLEGKKVVLFVGDFGLRKGLRYLVDAVPRIANEIPDVMFLLIGGTPKWLGTRIYWQMLHEQVVKLQVQKHVKLMDSVAHFELPTYYSLADVFVLPSLYEGLGKVLLEAMACGKAIVATNVGGIPEIVIDGVDGILVPPRQPEKIANAIIELLCDPKRAKEMGVRGRHKVLANFTWRHAAEKTINIYKQLTN